MREKRKEERTASWMEEEHTLTRIKTTCGDMDDIQDVVCHDSLVKWDCIKSNGWAH